MDGQTLTFPLRGVLRGRNCPDFCVGGHSDDTTEPHVGPDITVPLEDGDEVTIGRWQQSGAAESVLGLVFKGTYLPDITDEDARRIAHAMLEAAK